MSNLITDEYLNQLSCLKALFFDIDDTFPSKGRDAIKTHFLKIKNFQSKTIFRNINPGTYAIALFHDENSNSLLDTNFLGIPVEGYGFSNNAKAILSAPSFENASFKVIKENISQTILINYL